MNFEKTALPQDMILKNDIHLTLRRAGPRDAEQLLIFIDQVAGESENITFGPGEFGLSVEEERASLRQTASAPTSLYLIAEVAGEIAGTLTFSAGERPRLQHAGEFGMTALRKYWNIWIGSQMLAYLI